MVIQLVMRDDKIELLSGSEYQGVNIIIRPASYIKRNNVKIIKINKV